MFKPVSNKVAFPAMEERILGFWKENSTFEKSLKKNEGKDEYRFYDGPPFATGLPHYGHLLAGIIKDIVPRYQTMRSKYVERRFGWDTHGLPIEALAQDALGVAGAPEIKALGVRAAISLKPATPAEAIFPMMKDLDMVLVMTVEPGFGGQKMMPDMLPKIRAIRKYAIENGMAHLDIEVDGGITAENVHLMTEAGANVVVAGSAIFGAADPAQVIADMKKVAAEHPFVG